MGSEDYLHALETMGKILLFTPVLVSLILFVGSTPDMGSFTVEEAFFAHMLMTSAGFFTLVYAAALRFRQGLKRNRLKETG